MTCWKICFALCWTSCCMCHPQCLDFKPPFSSQTPNPFCPQYKDFGCCANSEDSTLRHTFSQLETVLISKNAGHCRDFVKDLLCQSCSPYAAHIFDFETGSGRIFPGLCDSYCRQLYKQCKEALLVFLTGIIGLNELVDSLSSEDAFCTKVGLPDQDYCFPDLLTNPALNGNITLETVNSEGCLCVEQFADSLHNPVFMKYPEDESGRLFVGEQKGIISIFDQNGIRLPEPFLDIVNVTELSYNRFDERGLLGMAFHPQYRTNGRFYVYYVTRETAYALRISEFKVSSSDWNKAERGSQRVLIEHPKVFHNHNGGELLFGDDGFLYIFLGDGGSAGDPRNNSQNLGELYGKVLRIDVDSPPGTGGVGSPDLPYAIPTDNPFLDHPGARPEIYAYGVRNIWRCGKDRGDPITGYGKGRILCGDVGQAKFEEIDEIKKGANYGWRGREGYECYDRNTCGNTGPEVLPIFAYPHSVGKSVTGGHIYRGCNSPNLNGQYIYGDFSFGKLFRLLENRETGQWENKLIDMCGPKYCNNGLVAHPHPYIMAFAEDSAGEVYILSSAAKAQFTPDAGIFKIVDPRRRSNPLLCANEGKSPRLAAPGLLTNFTTANKGDGDDSGGRTVSIAGASVGLAVLSTIVLLLVI